MTKQCMMCSRPGSTPNMGRAIDFFRLKKSYHTFIADVTIANFHVDEDEECYVDAVATAKIVVWPETR